MPVEDEREPVGLMAPEDYARSRAAFWGGAAVLFTDAEGKVLVLDPAYRPGTLLLPGGGVDQRERPSAAAVREVAEELGLPIGVRRLLAVDWVSMGNPEFGTVYGLPGETISIWDGGVLEESDIARICLPEDEISSFHFLPPAQAVPQMFPIEGRRMLGALRARIDRAGPAVLEDGEAVGGGPALQRQNVIPRIAVGYQQIAWHPGSEPAADLPVKQAWVWAFDPLGRVVVLVDPRDGHCVLPGGTVEAEDDGPTAAALREAAEEADLHLRDATYLGYLHDPDGAVYGPGTGPNARARYIARITSLGPAPQDVATGITYGRLLVSPMQASELLGLGRAGSEQAEYAARTAAARWGIPLSPPQAAVEIPRTGMVAGQL
ncbi:NUDIX hydrolase [Streptomyces davaonensis JCM 4913]|uniref:NUDIX hydrolase n=1 Tax=Streptomyces davaonensis (strain DSM 101723 / JCM 4913 / KCC S-0913 / 768) TaxID=1214101 RepID=K4RG60_STRDJ|nr:NUDIX hydrolase [Streptomyces davaonensis]CCK32139.1 NUDIX hydrolase [Streptomyces davaonensis JCM 4913]